MYVLYYVQFDCFKSIDILNRDDANKKYVELKHDPTVKELEAFITTVDVKFTSNGKEYTYYTEINLSGYNKIITPTGETLQIVRSKLRSPKELKAMAKSRGFSSFKVLHGTAIK